MKRILVAALAFFPVTVCAQAPVASSWFSTAAFQTARITYTPAEPIQPPALIPPAPLIDPSAWLKVGGPFGSRMADGSRSWQFGIDKSETAGGCIGWNVPDKAAIGGPCRDFLILAHRGQKALHVGGMFGWDSAHAHSALVGRLGINVGPATGAFLNYVADKIPAVEALSSWRAPKALAYIGKITSVDYFGGPSTNAAPDKSRWPHGPELKVDVPLPDVWALITGK